MRGGSWRRAHDVLLEERGLYAALWRIQTGEVHALRSTA
jgi:hypothetical protein